MVSRDKLGEGAQRSDMVANFQIDGQPVRGRIARLGAESLDPILKRHDYPIELARILGEALILASLVGSSLKFEGRLLIQAEGDGAVSMLVAEYATNGDLRGYARFDRDRWDKLESVTDSKRAAIPDLFGAKGVLGLIIVHADPSMQPYQGVVPLSQPTLSGCASEYFERSEQVPSQLSLAVGQLTVTGTPAGWRGGGILMQRMAGDEARGDTQEAWSTASTLFETLSDEELIDPDLSPERLLYRLFHELGVRFEAPQEVRDACSCNEARLRSTLETMPDPALRELVEPDGSLSINCQFCNRHYAIPIEDVTEAPDG